MTKLHIGSGPIALPGWVNIDLLPYPNVDRVLDVRGGLPFDAATHIYAEHFVEHLTPDESMAILRACRRSLHPDGVLRLSTPNLDWVLQTHYRPAAWNGAGDALADCFALNKAFHGWGHKFLFNRDTLRQFLMAAGFAEIEFVAYGSSSDPDLRGLERHPPSADTELHQHVLVAEARGVGASADLAVDCRIDYRRDTEMPFHALQYSVLWATRVLNKAGRFAAGLFSRGT
jgi:predicted SAM-dependent methyltransferase